jgi:plasmid maintenance system antidote protein VapI
MTPTHPGEVLLEDFMRPVELSVDVLAATLRMPPAVIAAIVA